MGGARSACGGEVRRIQGFFVVKAGNRPLARPRRRWEDNITIDPQGVGCWGMDCNELAQDRWRALVSAVMNLRVA